MPQATYDAIAEWYDEQVRTDLSPFHEMAIGAILEMLGDLQRTRDLRPRLRTRCRHARAGNAGRARHRRRYLGAAAEIARREESDAPLGITYLHDDAQMLATLPDATFDAVTCNLALIDIPDLDAVVAAVRRCLRPGGAFVFAITHSCIVPPGSSWTMGPEGELGRHVRGYYAEGFVVPPHAPGVRGKVGTYHRTLSTYLNTLAAARFILERIAEPRATGVAAERQPGFAEVPMFLAARFVKG